MPSTSHLALFVPSLKGGGAERVVTTLANAFVEKGHRTDLFLTSKHGPYLESLDETVSLFSFDKPHTSHTIPSLITLLRRRQPDVLLSALPSATVAAYVAVSWLRIWDEPTPKLYATVHNLLSTILHEQANTLRAYLLLYAFRFVLQTSTPVISVSHTVAHDVASCTGRPEHTIQVIPNPLSPQFYREPPLSSVPHPWLAQEAPVLVVASRLVKEKNLSTFLRALEHLQSKTNARALILGDGPERTALQTLSHTLDLSNVVDFLGFVNNPRAFMAQADTFVLPSSHEPFGNVVVEALACKTPVIALEGSGGPEEILAPFRSHYPALSRKEPAALADTIAATLQQSISDVPLHDRARDFRASDIADRYLALFAQQQDFSPFI